MSGIYWWVTATAAIGAILGYLSSLWFLFDSFLNLRAVNTTNDCQAKATARAWAGVALASVLARGSVAVLLAWLLTFPLESSVFGTAALVAVWLAAYAVLIIQIWVTYQRTCVRRSTK